jgi:hypothetical protein
MEYGTKFSLLKYLHDEILIYGIGLCFENKEEALDSFSVMQNYLSSAKLQERLFEVSITEDIFQPDKYTLSLKVHYDRIDCETKINEIDGRDIREILGSLKEIPYYFIAWAYYNSAEEIEFMPLNNYHIFKKDILFNGKRIQGKSMKDFPINIFDEL